MKIRKWTGVICAAALIVGVAGAVIYHEKFAAPPVEHWVTLTWVASTSKVDGYRIYRSDSSGGEPIFIGRTPATETTYKDLQVRAGASYRYVVTAVDAQGIESVKSNPTTVTVPVP